MGAYCRNGGFCHCDAPYYNNTWPGRCELIVCRSDADCTEGGDKGASCMGGRCHCSSVYRPEPTNGGCHVTDCRKVGGDKWCARNGDLGAYCRPDNGGCHCDAMYRNYPTDAYCTKVPVN